MLLKIFELNLPLDEVIYYNTGMEFDCIYNLRDKIIPILKNKNIEFTELYPQRPFLYDMLEKTVKHRDGTITNTGYSWCGGGQMAHIPKSTSHK